MKKFLLIPSLALGIIIASCTDAPKEEDKMTSESKDTVTTTTDTYDATMVRTAIEEDNKKFMEHFKKGDSTALAAHYASDGLIMPPNSESVGRDGLAPLWGSLVRMGLTDLKLTTQDVTGNNDLVVETGTYELYAKDKMADKGKYVVVWKNESGTWKIFRDIFNTSMAAGK
jgi:ketosteroid isomerase-like protein